MHTLDATGTVRFAARVTKAEEREGSSRQQCAHRWELALPRLEKAGSSLIPRHHHDERRRAHRVRRSDRGTQAQSALSRHTLVMTILPNTDPVRVPVPVPIHALVGTVLLAIGGMLFVNINEDPEVFAVFTVAFAAPGLYLIIAGAVERGITLARR